MMTTTMTTAVSAIVFIMIMLVSSLMSTTTTFSSAQQIQLNPCSGFTSSAPGATLISTSINPVDSTPYDMDAPESTRRGTTCYAIFRTTSSIDDMNRAGPFCSRYVKGPRGGSSSAWGATVKNSDFNQKLAQLIPSSFSSSPVKIDGFSSSSGWGNSFSFSWLDGETSDAFTNFGGSTGASPSASGCVAVNADGSWTVVDCKEGLLVACGGEPNPEIPLLTTQTTTTTSSSTTSSTTTSSTTTSSTTTATSTSTSTSTATPTTTETSSSTAAPSTTESTTVAATSSSTMISNITSPSPSSTSSAAATTNNNTTVINPPVITNNNATTTAPAQQETSSTAAPATTLSSTTSAPTTVAPPPSLPPGTPSFSDPKCTGLYTTMWQRPPVVTVFEDIPKPTAAVVPDVTIENYTTTTSAPTPVPSFPPFYTAHLDITFAQGLVHELNVGGIFFYFAEDSCEATWKKANGSPVSLSAAIHLHGRQYPNQAKIYIPSGVAGPANIDKSFRLCIGTTSFAQTAAATFMKRASCFAALEMVDTSITSFADTGFSIQIVAPVINPATIQAIQYADIDREITTTSSSSSNASSSNNNNNNDMLLEDADAEHKKKYSIKGLGRAFKLAKVIDENNDASLLVLDDGKVDETIVTASFATNWWFSMAATDFESNIQKSYLVSAAGYEKSGGPDDSVCRRAPIAGMSVDETRAFSNGMILFRISNLKVSPFTPVAICFDNLVVAPAAASSAGRTFSGIVFQYDKDRVRESRRNLADVESLFSSVFSSSTKVGSTSAFMAGNDGETLNVRTSLQKSSSNNNNNNDDNTAVVFGLLPFYIANSRNAGDVSFPDSLSLDELVPPVFKVSPAISGRVVFATVVVTASNKKDAGTTTTNIEVSATYNDFPVDALPKNWQANSALFLTANVDEEDSSNKKKKSSESESESESESKSDNGSDDKDDDDKGTTPKFNTSSSSAPPKPTTTSIPTSTTAAPPAVPKQMKKISLPALFSSSPFPMLTSPTAHVIDTTFTAASSASSLRVSSIDKNQGFQNGLRLGLSTSLTCDMSTSASATFFELAYSESVKKNGGGEIQQSFIASIPSVISNIPTTFTLCALDNTFTVNSNIRAASSFIKDWIPLVTIPIATEASPVILDRSDFVTAATPQTTATAPTTTKASSATSTSSNSTSAKNNSTTAPPVTSTETAVPTAAAAAPAATTTTLLSAQAPPVFAFDTATLHEFLRSPSSTSLLSSATAIASDLYDKFLGGGNSHGRKRSALSSNQNQEFRLQKTEQYKITMLGDAALTSLQLPEYTTALLGLSYSQTCSNNNNQVALVGQVTLSDANSGTFTGTLDVSAAYNSVLQNNVLYTPVDGKISGFVHDTVFNDNRPLQSNNGKLYWCVRWDSSAITSNVNEADQIHPWLPLELGTQLNPVPVRFVTPTLSALDFVGYFNQRRSLTGGSDKVTVVNPCGRRQNVGTGGSSKSVDDVASRFTLSIFASSTPPMVGSTINNKGAVCNIESSLLVGRVVADDALVKNPLLSQLTLPRSIGYLADRIFLRFGGTTTTLAPPPSLSNSSVDDDSAVVQNNNNNNNNNQNIGDNSGVSSGGSVPVSLCFSCSASATYSSVPAAEDQQQLLDFDPFGMDSAAVAIVLWFPGRVDTQWLKFETCAKLNIEKSKCSQYLRVASLLGGSQASSDDDEMESRNGNSDASSSSGSNEQSIVTVYFPSTSYLTDSDRQVSSTNNPLALITPAVEDARSKAKAQTIDLFDGIRQRQLSLVVPSVGSSQFGSNIKPRAVGIFYVNNQSLVQGTDVTILTDMNESSYTSTTTIALVVGLVAASAAFFYFVSGAKGPSSSDSSPPSSPTSKSKSSSSSSSKTLKMDPPTVILSGTTTPIKGAKTTTTTSSVASLEEQKKEMMRQLDEMKKVNNNQSTNNKNASSPSPAKPSADPWSEYDDSSNKTPSQQKKSVEQEQHRKADDEIAEPVQQNTTTEGSNDNNGTTETIEGEENNTNNNDYDDEDPLYAAESSEAGSSPASSPQTQQQGGKKKKGGKGGKKK